MSSAPAPPTTSDRDVLERWLPEHELQERFEVLQRKLTSQWDLIDGFTTASYGMVVVPSLTSMRSA